MPGGSEPVRLLIFAILFSNAASRALNSSICTLVICRALKNYLKLLQYSFINHHRHLAHSI